MRFFGYVRRSTDRQEQSLEGQRTACEALAAKLGGRIEKGDFFEDDAVTGSDLQRPGLLALLRECERRKDVAGVVIWDRSRLARASDPRAALALEMGIENTGKRIHYVNSSSPNDGTIGSHIIALVESESAGRYLLDLARNVTRGMAQKASEGTLGRVPPYGYDAMYTDARGEPLFVVRYNADHSKDMHEPLKRAGGVTLGRLIRTLQGPERLPRSRSDKGTLVLGDVRRQAVVRRIFDMAAKERLGFKRIAQRLNHGGVPGPTGGKWPPSSIHDILINPVYRGAERWNYRSRAKFFRQSKDGIVRVTERTGKRLVLNPADDVMIREGVFPAIVSASIWHAAQKARLERQRRTYRGKGARAAYLVSGIAYCPNGHRLQGYKTASKGRTYHQYRCSVRHTYGPSSCQASNVLRENVDPYVVAWVRDECIAALLGEPDLIGDCGRTTDDNDLRARIAKIERTLARIVETIDEENLPLLDKKMTALREEKAALESQVTADHEPGDIKSRVTEFLSNAQRVLDEATPEEIKDLVRCFVEKVEVDCALGTARLYYYEPAESLRRQMSIQMERVKGIGPSTSTLARGNNIEALTCTKTPTSCAETPNTCTDINFPNEKATENGSGRNTSDASISPNLHNPSTRCSTRSRKEAMERMKVLGRLRGEIMRCRALPRESRANLLALLEQEIRANA